MAGERNSMSLETVHSLISSGVKTTTQEEVNCTRSPSSPVYNAFSFKVKWSSILLSNSHSIHRHLFGTKKSTTATIKKWDNRSNIIHDTCVAAQREGVWGWGEAREARGAWEGVRGGGEGGGREKGRERVHQSPTLLDIRSQMSTVNRQQIRD